MTPTQTEPILYTLRLRQTPAHRFYVERGIWFNWGGDAVVMNAERISPYYWYRDRTKDFCREYTAANPGCATYEKAVENLERLSRF